MKDCDGEKRSRYLFRWMPLFSLCIACATILGLMLGGFYDAFEAEASLRLEGFTMESGPAVLFVLLSGVFGWFSALLIERASGRADVVLMCIAVPVCWVTIAGGFGLTWLLWRRFPDEVEVLFVLCGFFAAGTIVARNFWTDLF